ncbi:acyl-CoA dehydrogenase family protein [Hydrogenophaga sp. BPS33]|uniref:acyl-CoA dehydrogenase family protein n=1 Tax=Hydrogenophaga sp. BPS33 TaxID=2651974 RepID=UPI00131F85D2|nr:acyl-CoA dehydrogenase family protein [Hydrogenophaga sp. BPS33]QHE84599.1 pimeloyl-CoA dehydrogenase large subunit [Hydrogenophaga sp. BPS33]
MNLNFSPEHQAFRAEVRDFLNTQLPLDIRERTLRGEKLSKDDHIRWQRVLAARGWLAHGWSKAYGGTGWGPIERFIWDEEVHLAGAPRRNIPAIDLLGPLIIEYGTEEQKQRFLPPILASEHWWCQGFSEPQAGSDLAALKMRAVREGDHYWVNGTKLWTSYAQESNWIFCLVRTSQEEKKQAGISYLLIPMDQPGVTVSPIITVGGVHAVNQVTIENVRVPLENRLGPEGAAWSMTQFLLSHERIVGAGIGASTRYIEEARAFGRRTRRNGVLLSEQPRFRERLASLEAELMALKYTAYRVLADEVAGKAEAAVVSVVKLRGGQLQQAITELMMEEGGQLSWPDVLTLPEGDPVVPPEDAYHAQQAFDRRKLTIYGGSAEIQRNIIAKRILRV